MHTKPWERYEVALRKLGPDNDNLWLAHIPQLDGCRAYGQTPEAAMDELDAVATMYVEVAEEDGEALPLPLSDVPREFSGRFVVRVTSSLHKALSDRAKAEGVSLNHLCYELLAMGIGERRALTQVNHYHIATRDAETQESL